MGIFAVLTLLINRRGKINLLESRENKIVFGIVFIVLLILFIKDPWLFVVFIVGSIIILGLLLIAGFGEINFLQWSNQRRVITGLCTLAILVYVLPFFPTIPSLQLILFFFWIFSFGNMLLIPSIGVGLLFSTIPKEIKHQYLAFVVATLLAGAVIYISEPSLKVADWWV
jgi:hypothetical protein